MKTIDLKRRDPHRIEVAKILLDDVVQMTGHIGRLKLRSYQQCVADAVVRSVVDNLGLSIVVMYPRQSGKNELQAQIEAYLLVLYQKQNIEMVKISPTWKPQSLNAMRRLERVLNRNLATRRLWTKESGYIYRLDSARIFFLSGSPETNIVGATANPLLEVDEAQDIRIPKFDKDIAPMASSTNATRVFWGTAWTSHTLLARELRLAREAEKRDGIRRAFVVDADEVAREIPVYGRFVAEQVARMGRSHPFIRTQYFAEEIDAEGEMFSPTRLALMQGEHDLLEAPQPGEIYAALIDLAGEDEGASDDPVTLQNPLRDLTAMTIVRCNLDTLADDLIQAPTYQVVQRYQWIGIRHSEIYGRLRALLLHWKIRWAVVDATGVGAGLTSFLIKAFGEKILPFTFSASSKSKLGWDFLAICDNGRWQEPKAGTTLADGSFSQSFWQQCVNCAYRVMDGPGRRMQWGVPDGKRDPVTGEVLHDDLLISAALSSILDERAWSLPSASVILQARDILEDLDEGF